MRARVCVCWWVCVWGVFVECVWSVCGSEEGGGEEWVSVWVSVWVYGSVCGECVSGVWGVCAWVCVGVWECVWCVWVWVGVCRCVWRGVCGFVRECVCVNVCGCECVCVTVIIMIMSGRCVVCVGVGIKIIIRF